MVAKRSITIDFAIEAVDPFIFSRDRTEALKALQFYFASF